MDNQQCETWFRQKDLLTLKRKDELINLRYTLIDAMKSGKISQKDFRARIEELNAQLRKGNIVFASKQDFQGFSTQLSISLGLEHPHIVIQERVSHEIEHANVYEKYHLPYFLGWDKVWNEERQAVGYIPFCSIDETSLSWKALPYRTQLAIQLESIVSASEKSESDIIEIAWLKKELGAIE